MNKSNINELSAQTEADSNSTAQNPSVSQPNANTNVVGSLVGQREIKFRYIFKTFDGRFIVEYFTLKELEYGGLQTFLDGLHDIIIVAKCQYTGLKDKNGKEIYEGDIYNMGDKNILYVVVWHDSGLIGKQISSSSYAGLEHWKEKIEVVGNIFETPELLETLR